MQEAYMAILGQTPRIVAASLIAYFAGEFTNSYILARMKVLTRGRWLAARTIGSTIAGQGVDTIIFVMAAFFGVYPNSLLLLIIISNYIFKVLMETVLTPVTYKIVGCLKKAEGVDHYDRDTDFNPFKVFK
jgi:queuosine precursor transporter